LDRIITDELVEYEGWSWYLDRSWGCWQEVAERLLMIVAEAIRIEDGLGRIVAQAMFI
jgi:hypothetical protein